MSERMKQSNASTCDSPARDLTADPRDPSSVATTAESEIGTGTRVIARQIALMLWEHERNRLARIGDDR